MRERGKERVERDRGKRGREKTRERKRVKEAGGRERKKERGRGKEFCCIFFNSLVLENPKYGFSTKLKWNKRILNKILKQSNIFASAIPSALQLTRLLTLPFCSGYLTLKLRLLSGLNY